MKNTLIYNNQQFFEQTFLNRESFVNFIYSNANSIFGENTILLKINCPIIDDTTKDFLPDAFLFEFNPDNKIKGVFVKIGFSGEIIGRTLKKIFKLHINSYSRKHSLFPKLFSYLPEKSELKKDFQSKIGNESIYEFIEKCVLISHSVLLVLDNETPLLEYQDKTLGMWDTLYAKEYINDSKESIIRVSKDYYKCTIEELLKII